MRSRGRSTGCSARWLGHGRWPRATPSARLRENEALANRIFDASPVREQGWRSAKGLQRLAKKYGDQRLETACAHALHFGARSYKPVERLLALGREKLTSTETTTPGVAHEKVRGPGYFH